MFITASLKTVGRFILASLLIAFIYLPFQAQANPGSLDSLYQELETAGEDTIKAHILLRLVNDQQYQPEIALPLARQSLELSKKLDYEQGEADSYYYLFKIYRNIGELDTAVYYADLAVDQAKAYKNRFNEGKAWNNKGAAASMTSDFESAHRYFHNALEAFEELGDKEQISGTLNNIAIVYNMEDQPKKELETMIRVLEIEEELGDPYGLARTYLNLGQCYITAKDPKNAKKYIELSKKLSEENGFHMIEAVSLAAFGDIHSDLKEWEKAIESYLVALKKSEEHNLVYVIASITNSLGTAYGHLNQWEEAKKYCLQSLPLQEQIGDLDRLALVLLNLADAEISLKNLYNAKDYLDRCEEILQEYKGLHKLTKYQKILYRYYKANKDPIKALKALEQHAKLKDSLDTQRQEAELRQLETQLETERKEQENILKEQENQILKQEKSLQAATIDNQRNTNYAIGIGLGLMALIALVIGISRYRQVRLNKALSKQKQEIEKQNEEKDLLLKEIHHRVKNNLQIVSSLLDLQSNRIDDPKALNAIEQGQNRVMAMALIHQRLYQNEDIASIDFQGYLKELTEQIASIYEDGESVRKTVSAPNMELDIDTAIPLGLIANELITNAYKYAFKGDSENKGSDLSIKVENQGGGDYAMTIEDNGPGLPEGFDWKKTRSLGLRLANRLSKQLHGSLMYSNDSGSAFTIQFKDTLSRKEAI